MDFERRPERLLKEHELGRQRLPDGSVLTAWAAQDGMFVQRESSGVVTAQLRFPFPWHGLGGGQLVVSPRGRRVVFSYFSGQSEEGFELIGLDDGLSWLAHQSYVSGETPEFGFSPDEDLFVAFVPRRCDTWWPHDDDELEDTDDGRRRFHLGRIVVHSLANDEMTAHELTGSTSRAGSPESAEWLPRPIPEVGDRTVRLPLPWGAVELRLPLAAQVVVDVP